MNISKMLIYHLFFLNYEMTVKDCLKISERIKSIIESSMEALTKYEDLFWKEIIELRYFEVQDIKTFDHYYYEITKQEEDNTIKIRAWDKYGTLINRCPIETNTFLVLLTIGCIRVLEKDEFQKHIIDYEEIS